MNEGTIGTIENVGSPGPLGTGAGILFVRTDDDVVVAVAVHVPSRCDRPTKETVGFLVRRSKGMQNLGSFEWCHADDKGSHS